MASNSTTFREVRSKCFRVTDEAAWPANLLKLRKNVLLYKQKVKEMFIIPSEGHSDPDIQIC